MYRKVVYLLERNPSEYKGNTILMVHSQMQSFLRTLLMINDNEYNNSSVIIRPNKKTKLHTTKFPS